MSRLGRALLCAILALSLFATTLGRRTSGGSHSYPSSRGLSGGSRGHSYPTSHSGLSGNSGGHVHPSNVGGSHGYPSSGGLSGTGSHGYPSSGGISGNRPQQHGYPSSPGLSGSNTPKTNYPQSGTTTHVHHHYNYQPPQQIRYTPSYGGAPMSYPVYHGSPPNYVYQYKDSGSKYSSLLAGLALFNLGALTSYAVTSHNSHREYKPTPGEVCKMRIVKENKDFEETRINCNLMSSIIWEEQAKKNPTAQNGTTGTSIVTTTMTNTTTINSTFLSTGSSSDVNVTYNGLNVTMLPNGTVVPIDPSHNGTIEVNGTAVNMTEVNGSFFNVTAVSTMGDNVPTPPHNTVTSSSTIVTVTNTTTLTDAVQVKGPPVEVTPGMQCFLMRTSQDSRIQRSVPCGLLQEYAVKSLKRSASVRKGPTMTLVGIAALAVILYI